MPDKKAFNASNQYNLGKTPVNETRPKVSHYTVDEGDEGQRLDNFLIKHLKGVPKTHVYRLIRSGQVRVNKARASADSRLSLGDLIRLPPVKTSDSGKTEAAKAEQELKHPVIAREFTILFEDDAFIAINKPAGVAVHGGSGVSFGVIEHLRKARPQAKFLELVHRLDRETSGILLIAKKRSALTHLQNQFRARETGKTYLTLVIGNWPGQKKVLNQPLHKYLLDNGERRVKIVDPSNPNGMPSVSLVKKVAVGPQHPALDHEVFSLLEVTIKTGRTHQIRVHLAGNGHVIAGDDKYGHFEMNKKLAKIGLKRMFLHAWRLRLQHPVTGQEIQFLCPLDQELSAVLQYLIPTVSVALPIEASKKT